MPGFDPDQFLADTAPSGASGSFDPDRFLAETAPRTSVPKAKETGVADSLMRGAASGATAGFADELYGLLGAVANPTGSDKGFWDRYELSRDYARRKDALSKEEHPVASGVGTAAGAIGSAFLPGMKLLNAGKGAGIAEMAGKGAIQGALTGAGEADKLSDVPDAAWSGAKVGGLVGGGLGVAGKVGGAVLDAMKPAKVASVLFNAPEEAVKRYIESPATVNAARPRSKLVEDFLGRVEGLKNDVVEGSQASRRTLDFEGEKMSGNELADIFKRHADDIVQRSEGVMDDPKKVAAVNWLRNMEKNYRPAIPEDTTSELAKFFEHASGEGGPTQAFFEAHKAGLPGGMTAADALAAEADRKLSTNRVKDLVQSLQRRTQYEVGPGQFHDVDDLIRQKVAGEVNAALKARSPVYASQMENVAKDSGILNGVADLAKSPQGFDNLLKRTQRGNTPHLMDSLKLFDERTGGGLLQELQESSVKDALNKGYIHGSRAVNAYGEAGAALGEKWLGVPGKFAGRLGGVALGATVDKYGGPMARGAVDMSAKLRSVVQSSDGLQKLGKYAGPLIDAAKRGNQSLAATHYVLDQTDPQYREKHKEIFGDPADRP